MTSSLAFAECQSTSIDGEALCLKAEQPGHLNVYKQLFSTAEQLLPHLKSQQFCAADSLQLTPENPAAIKKLYQSLQASHPEAGKVYWAHRSWQLAIWQPVLLSIICVYANDASLPFSRLKVHCQDSTIAGYQLAINEQYRGTKTALIEHAAKQCKQLITSFYQQINQLYPLKKRLSQQMLSDQVIAALAKVPLFLPQIKTADFASQVQLWLTSYQLVPRDITFHENGDLIRSSCCLAYRLSDTDYCTNCPKERRKNVTT